MYKSQRLTHAAYYISWIFHVFPELFLKQFHLSYLPDCPGCFLYCNGKSWEDFSKTSYSNLEETNIVEGEMPYTWQEN